MIKNSLLITFFIFLFVFLFLIYSKCECLYYEKFSNIEIVNPKQDSNVNDLLYGDNENNNENKNIVSDKSEGKIIVNKSKSHKDISNSHKDISSKDKFSTKVPEVDYKNDSILLSCFKKHKLDTFNKYEKYASKVLYKHNGEVVGEVWITPSHIMKHLPQITLNGYFLNNLCVKKEHRRKGIARKLLKRVIKKAQDENKLHILLHVESSKNPHLVKFYSELGFQTYITNVNNNGDTYKLMFLPL